MGKFIVDKDLDVFKVEDVLLETNEKIKIPMTEDLRVIYEEIKGDFNFSEDDLIKVSISEKFTIKDIIEGNTKRFETAEVELVREEESKFTNILLLLDGIYTEFKLKDLKKLEKDFRFNEDNSIDREIFKKYKIGREFYEVYSCIMDEIPKYQYIKDDYESKKEFIDRIDGFKEDLDQIILKSNSVMDDIILDLRDETKLEFIFIHFRDIRTYLNYNRFSKTLKIILEYIETLYTDNFSNIGEIKNKLEKENYRYISNQEDFESEILYILEDKDKISGFWHEFNEFLDRERDLNPLTNLSKYIKNVANLVFANPTSFSGEDLDKIFVEAGCEFKVEVFKKYLNLLYHIEAIDEITSMVLEFYEELERFLDLDENIIISREYIYY